VAVYGDRSDFDANQGDVFVGVPFNGFEMDGMITSHDCVCDKYLSPRTPLSPEAADRFTISVAPVHSVAELTGDRRAAVRDNGMPRYFYSRKRKAGRSSSRTCTSSSRCASRMCFSARA
jgi:hypothetical protein